MLAVSYQERISGVLGKIWETQIENIEKASALMAETIAMAGLAHLFGSGHSVLPCRICFRDMARIPVSAVDGYAADVDQRDWKRRREGTAMAGAQRRICAGAV